MPTVNTVDAGVEVFFEGTPILGGFTTKSLLGGPIPILRHSLSTNGCVFFRGRPKMAWCLPFGFPLRPPNQTQGSFVKRRGGPFWFPFKVARNRVPTPARDNAPSGGGPVDPGGACRPPRSRKRIGSDRSLGKPVCF